MKKAISLVAILALTIQSTTAQLPERSLAALHLMFKKSNADTARVNTALQLSQYFIFKSGRTEREMDSSFFYAEIATNLSIKLKYVKGEGEGYLMLARFYHTKRIIEKGKAYAAKAFQLFSNGRYQLDLGEACFELASYYVLNGNDLSARLRLIEQALTAFEKSGNREKVAITYRELADLNQVQHNYTLSLQLAQRALALFDSLHYTKMYGMYDLLGTILLQLDDFKQALKYNLLAVKQIEMAHDTSLQLCTVYLRTAAILTELHRLEESREYYFKALDIAVKYKELDYIISVCNNLPAIYLVSNQESEIVVFLKRVESYYDNADIIDRLILKGNYLVAFTRLKDFKNAADQYRQMTKLSEKLTDTEDLKVYYRYAMNYLLGAALYPEAATCMAGFAALCKKEVRVRDRMKINYWNFKVDSAAGNYVSAIRSFQLYEGLRDSITSESTSREIQQLNIEFQTEKKDHTLLLKDQYIQLRQQQIELLQKEGQLQLAANQRKEKDIALLTDKQQLQLSEAEKKDQAIKLKDQDIKLKEQSITLLTKEGLIKEASLKATRTSGNIIIGTAAMLAILLALGYNRYRLKQNTNNLLEKQQKEITEKNRSLQHLLTEKDWLVKEIHHRVKNNFHIVMGLLGTQSGYLKNEEAKSAVSESQQRVHAMSLIHQKLYQSENLSAISMPAYVSELVEYLKDSFDVKHLISFQLQVDRIDLDVSYSMPVGLILNEAITNAIKYAFPGRQDGVVTISLQHTGEDSLLLSIADNGVGIPEGFNFSNNNSMGMNLMQGLSKDIGGTFSMERRQGTLINISFQYDPEISSNTLSTGQA